MPESASHRARRIIALSAAAGVQDFVVCPGSRSGPLAHVLAEAASPEPPLGAPRINVHVRIDERSAAFLALGWARAQGRPVAVVTTSGTAVGNLLPAVMEAHHSGVPLLLLTADRPLELQQVGANQTTVQTDIFGAFVNSSVTIEADGDDLESQISAAVLAALGGYGPPGPVHINIRFREPLGPDGSGWPQPEAPSLERPEVLESPDLPYADRTIVVAGDGAGPQAAEFALAHGWPLFAEPTSGARWGNAAVPNYLPALESAAGQRLAAQAHQVIVVGRPTLSRAVQRLLHQSPALIVAGFGARWRQAPAPAQLVLSALPATWLVPAYPVTPAVVSAWSTAWHKLGRSLAPKIGGRGASSSWDSATVAQIFAASLAPGQRVLVGASGPIRMLDRFAPVWPPSERPEIWANRGLAGIDGTISTGVGMALAGEPVTVLLGDLTFLHDVGGLLIGALEHRPRLRLVVVNDGGGTIFQSLEHAGGAHFDRMFLTPHQVRLEPLAAAYGWHYQAVHSVSQLAAALAEPVQATEIVEVVLTSHAD